MQAFPAPVKGIGAHRGGIASKNRSTRDAAIVFDIVLVACLSVAARSGFLPRRWARLANVPIPARKLRLAPRNATFGHHLVGCEFR
jgi:hypothetical protein